MLDLGAVKKQIDVMVTDRKAATNDYADRVNRAVREWERWKENPQALADKIARAKTSWLVGRPIEDVSSVADLPKRSPEITVIVADGS